MDKQTVTKVDRRTVPRSKNIPIEKEEEFIIYSRKKENDEK